MKKLIFILSILAFTPASFAAQFDGSIPEWKEEKETFKKPQESFQKALQLLKDKYADKNVTEEDLYRAATEGMLAGLNSGKENWNTLLTPRSVQDSQIEITGEVVGIGATLEFDENSKNAPVRAIISGSAAEKAGLQKRDQILTVNGKRYKNLRSMVMDIRGKAGESVKLKVLREDRIMDIKVTRAAVKIPLLTSAMVDSQTGFIMITAFTNETPAELKKQLSAFKNQKLGKLIVDLRSCRGGVFEKFLDVAGVFMNSGDILVKTKSRDGSIKEIKGKGEAWSPQTKIVVLIDPETSSSAEALAASLKENRQAILIGEKTAGKWTVESLERLPNDYYVKYSVLSLLSPSGKSYEGVGIKPDFETLRITESMGAIDYEFTKDIKSHIDKDPALKAALQLP